MLRWLLAIFLCASAAHALAQEKPSGSQDAAPPGEPGIRWLIQTSVWTDHFSTDSQHTKHQKLIGVERWAGNNWILGAAVFRNSFDQPSQYVYGGKLWRPMDSFPLLHLKLTGGILHGYKPPYEDKIPLNTENGWALVALPSIGLSGRRFAADLVVFGTAGVLLTIGVLVP